MSRFYIICALLLPLVGCAGFQVPGTDYRLGYLPIESSRTKVNANCTDLETLGFVADVLEQQHLDYIRTQNDEQAIRASDFLASLGSECQVRFVNLSVPEIKTELFGDIQTIADSGSLGGLGGLAFNYQDVLVRSGIELSLHVNQASQGPRRRLVAIYHLETGRVVHFNYSGTDNVDKKTRRWSLDKFFQTALDIGVKIVVP